MISAHTFFCFQSYVWFSIVKLHISTMQVVVMIVLEITYDSWKIIHLLIYFCIMVIVIMNTLLSHCIHGFNNWLNMFFTESNSLSKMSRLAHLNLSCNHFDKEILRFLGALPVLKFLDLSYNYMEGPLSSHGTCKIKFSSSRILWKSLETNWDFITNFTFIEIYFLHVKNHKMLDICKWLW